MTCTNPYPQSHFAADGRDILIGGLTESIAFQMRVNGTTVVSETYNYDADGQVLILGIADMVSQCLYGSLTAGSQPNARATVDFLIDGAVVSTHDLYSSRMRNPADPQGQKRVMAAATRATCHPGTPCYLTFIGSVAASLRRTDGSEIASVSVGSPGTVYTQDCDPQLLFPSRWQQGATVSFGGELEARIAAPACQDNVPVRFLNRYDVMESLVAAWLEEKPQATDSVSLMQGCRTRFGVKTSTEYTLKGMPMAHQEEYTVWEDLLTARKAQVWLHGAWQDIIVTKANYTHRRRRMYGQQAEISFQTANPNIIL